MKCPDEDKVPAVNRIICWILEECQVGGKVAVEVEKHPVAHQDFQFLDFKVMLHQKFHYIAPATGNP